MSEIKKFQDLVNQIVSDELVLPDFQRKFVWKEQKMKNLYASVLCRMPIGSILTLESDDASFACKRIGAKIRDNIGKIEPQQGEISYLIDGQQRVTTLFAGFTTYFFETYKNNSENLASKYLRNMFFIKIPTPTSNESIDDLFGVKQLQFPENILREKDFFSSGEMKEIVSSESPASIFQDKNITIIDILSSESIAKIEKYCTEEKGGAYHIPLQYINNDNNDIQLSYDSILAKIAASYAPYSTVEENEKKRKLWQKNIQKYLSESLLTLKLNQISVQNSDKSRAIDIYSNLNQGGAPLSVFDLVTAKVGGVPSISYNYYDKVVEYISNSFKIDNNILPDKSKTWLNNYKHTYDVVRKANIIDGTEISPQFIDVFLKVLTFSIMQEKSEKDFKPENLTKRDKILDLDPKKIADKTEKVCISLKRALLFFQTRCGIRKFSEINYKAQLGLVAFIFMNDSYWNNKSIHDFLEYWYWISLFGYKYATKQDISIYSEINLFLHFFNKKNYDCYKQLKDFKSHFVLKAHNLTEKETLTMKNVSSGITPPDKISTFICQFYLSEGYYDFHTDEYLNFLSDSDFQMHHIIPLGSDKKIGETTKEIRSNEKDVHNSPLNFIYITQTSNSDISDMKFSDYSKDEKVKRALANLHYNSEIDGVEIDSFIASRFNALENELVQNKLSFLEQSIELTWGIK